MAIERLFDSSPAGSGLPLILLAEDSADDVFLVLHAFKRAGIHNPVAVTADGRDVIDYLGGLEPYNDRALHPLPGLLILGINFPRMDGFNVLAWMENERDLDRIPVVVLGSSNVQAGIEKAKILRADDYRVKPSRGGEAMIEFVRDLNARWLSAAASLWAAAVLRKQTSDLRAETRTLQARLDKAHQHSRLLAQELSNVIKESFQIRGKGAACRRGEVRKALQQPHHN